MYDQTTPFPSLYTLIPVLGTALIIVFSDKKTTVSKILSTKLIVFIGLISYSVYLWHYPMPVQVILGLLKHLPIESI